MSFDREGKKEATPEDPGCFQQRKGREFHLGRDDDHGDAMPRMTNESCTFGASMPCHDLFAVFSKLNSCYSPSYEVDHTKVTPIRSISEEDLETERLTNWPKVTQQMNRFQIQAVWLLSLSPEPPSLL